MMPLASHVEYEPNDDLDLDYDDSGAADDSGGDSGNDSGGSSGDEG